MKASSEEGHLPQAARRLVLSLLVLAGLAPVAISIWQHQRIADCSRWSTADAVVTALRVHTRTNALADNRFRGASLETVVDFRFTYAFAGQSYTSTRFLYYGRPPLNHLLTRYPVGTRFRARVSPGNPSVALVEPGVPSPLLPYAGVPWLILAAGLGFSWRKRRTR